MQIHADPDPQPWTRLYALFLIESGSRLVDNPGSDRNLICLTKTENNYSFKIYIFLKKCNIFFLRTSNWEKPPALRMEHQDLRNMTQLDPDQIRTQTQTQRQARHRNRYRYALINRKSKQTKENKSILWFT